MVTDVMINILSDIILMIALWCITSSLKLWLTKMINEQTFSINSQLEELSAIANENKANYNQLKTRLMTLSHDVDKIDKRTLQLVTKLATLKCMRSDCDENAS
jgi:uncharacterized phage infection (PIP) family protein YhgE